MIKQDPYQLSLIAFMPINRLCFIHALADALCGIFTPG